MDKVELVVVDGELMDILLNFVILMLCLEHLKRTNMEPNFMGQQRSQLRLGDRLGNLRHVKVAGK